MSERIAPEPQATTPPRGLHIPEFDVMRGAAIIFVVYLHSYFSAWDVSPRREVVAMHAIHLFAHTAVPVFFFISADNRFNTGFFKLMNALFVVGFISSLLFVVAMARVAPSFASEFMGIEQRRKPT